MSAFEHSPIKLNDLIDERMLRPLQSGAISCRPDDSVRSESAFDTPLGPVRLQPIGQRQRACRASRGRKRRIVDAIVVAVVFAFVGTTLLFGPGGVTLPVAVVSAGVQ